MTVTASASLGRNGVKLYTYLANSMYFSCITETRNISNQSLMYSDLALLKVWKAEHAREMTLEESEREYSITIQVRFG